MKSNGSIMSQNHVQAAMLTVSQRIFAMSLSEKTCVTLKQSVSSCVEDNAPIIPAADKKETEGSPKTGIKTKENMLVKLLVKRRHSTTPAPMRQRETAPRPRPRNARSLTEIQVDTEIIDGLFTTTLCSTEL